MTFQPVLPLSGYTGWGFLKRTIDRQQAVQQALPVQQRDEAYFRQKIGGINTAAELVSDRRLLRVTLTAFGLEGDLNNRAFIQKILEGGTLTTGSLANRLADKQYQKLSAAFGFGDFSVPRTKISTFPDEILTRFRYRSFETAVGAQNNTYRLGLNAERELPELAARSISESAKWYTLLGNPPMREVIQTALGLPRSFASIDLDQQVQVLKDRTRQAFGSDTVSQFAEPARMEALIRRFVLRADLQAQGEGNSSAAIALQLLRR
ncbi:MAG: flagellar protein [Rhodobacterales bacterium 32-66-7]|nr:MAG: flagellar protein [Rhodobacterales bacterium 12-65-15]OYX24600.1 MAG: flagellar protein [Rhodobacterales bacterium 32-66-7]